MSTIEEFTFASSFLEARGRGVDSHRGCVRSVADGALAFSHAWVGHRRYCLTSPEAYSLKYAHCRSLSKFVTASTAVLFYHGANSFVQIRKDLFDSRRSIDNLEPVGLHHFVELQ